MDRRPHPTGTPMTDLVTLHRTAGHLAGTVLNDLCRRHDQVTCRRVDGALVFSVADEPPATPEPHVGEPAIAVENPAPGRHGATVGRRCHDPAVIEALTSNPPMRPAEIITAAGIPRGSSTSILLRLEGAGKIERTADGRWKLAGTPTRTTTTAAADPPPTVPAGPVGVEVGPLERRPFDADAARRRSAEGV